MAKGPSASENIQKLASVMLEWSKIRENTLQTFSGGWNMLKQILNHTTVPSVVPQLFVFRHESGPALREQQGRLRPHLKTHEAGPGGP